MWIEINGEMLNVDKIVKIRKDDVHNGIEGALIICEYETPLEQTRTRTMVYEYETIKERDEHFNTLKSILVIRKEWD